MNRPKAFLIKAINGSSDVVRRSLDSTRLGQRPRSTELERVRRRLELLLAAMYGRSISIEDAAPSRSRGFLARVVNRASRGRSIGGLAESDANTIRLPRVLADSAARGSATSQYRLLAIEHAERVVRGTAKCLRAEDAPLERDLYLLAEAAAIDCAVAMRMCALPEIIRRARLAELSARPRMSSLNAIEQQVEKLARQLLSSEALEPPQEIGGASSTADSLAWARTTAATLRARAGINAPRYRGVAPISLWGTVRGETVEPVERTPEQRMQDALNSASTLNLHIEQEGGSNAGAQQESADGSPGEASGGEAGDGDAGEANREPNSEPEGGDDSTSMREQLVQSSAVGSGADAAPPRASDVNPSLAEVDAARAAAKLSPNFAIHTEGTVYPEWDCNARAYRPRGATVRRSAPLEGDVRVADVILVEQGSIVRTLRHRFERMRARRVQLPRQRDGDELDLAACVRALVDARTGHTSDDRLYVDVRPARRPLAITILVDVSGSTAEPISDERRVIDVERVALLLASEALDALGDRYSILTFSSYGAEDVRVTHVKDFGEHNGEMVRRRISAIEPQGKTRLGAAIRHATAQLARQPVSHRLLLILSDGKPNDTDRYFEHYAAEDTRQAIIESRARGVYPFCLTVDREEGSEYLAHIFGQAGHTILRQADQLPFALLKGVQQLVAS
ncbi:MAG: VWA domain-containing protein [Gemmatimonadota bacterium]|nr:VWA domain-containing protein [Gemmatimonadota bacterium]